jgi:hypothetical protein
MHVIHNGNFHRYLADPVIGGERKARGLVPRNYATHPRGFYAAIQAVDIPLIPRSEWPDRIRDRVASKSQLSDVRRARGVPILDQNGKGYCWAHSTTAAVMTARVVMGEPTVELSAYMVACIVKGYRDEGGWGAESADFIAANGVPSSQFWPQRSMSRGNDNAAMRENAALHKVSGVWADLHTPEYDRNLTWEQYVTLWLSGCGTVNDYNWWSHSVHGLDPMDGQALFDAGEARDEDSGKVYAASEWDALWGMSDPVTAGLGCGFVNSWGTSYGDQGYGVIAAVKAVPDGGLGVLLTSPSVA